jgi:hypothetical protein
MAFGPRKYCVNSYKKYSTFYGLRAAVLALLAPTRSHTRMFKTLLFVATNLVAGLVMAQDNCEALREQIEAKIAANGVSQFSVSIVQSPAPEGARVVGTCAQGSKALVYNRAAAAATPAATEAPAAVVGAAAKPSKPKAAMLTECKDGRVITHGDCGK